MKQTTYSSIALFGTSADPPTTSHKALLIGLSKLFPTVATWASNNPGKEHITSLEQRRELLSILVETIDLPNLELRQELSSQWALMSLEQAKDYWPGKSLMLIIGSDLVKSLPTWFEAKKVLSKAGIGVVPRQGWPINSTELKAIRKMGGKVTVLPLDIPAAASSEIHSNPHLSYIPKAILPILKEKNLYGIS